MGYYVESNSKGHILSASFNNKVKELIEDGAKQVDGSKFEPNLICVVDNGSFAAAGYAFSEQEYEVFKHPDGRRKAWLVHPLAAKLSDFSS